MHTPGPVVIALDGSTHSAQTLRWGLAEASLREADVLVARACPGEDLAADREARRYLADVLDREGPRNPELTVESALLHGGAGAELSQLSEKAQLLVVGAQGRSLRARIGSVTGYVVLHARCPVAVVRGEPAASSTAPVVVAVDGSPASVSVARLAEREATLRRVPLVVVDAEALADGDPARVLAAAADGAQLVVVGSHGPGDVVRESTAAVIVVRGLDDEG